MKKNNSMVMPHSYMLVSECEMENINGGNLSFGGILNFISYLLGGLNISFGSSKNQLSTDTSATVSQATTGSVGGVHGTSVGASAVHTQVDTDSTGSYFNWDANFNLGRMFNALVGLFF